MTIQSSAPVRSRQPVNGGAGRVPPAGGRTAAAAPAAGGGGGGWMKVGDAAVRTAQAETERQREAERRRAEGLYMPFRFWVPVGETREVVILDSQLGPAFFEHQLQNPRNGRFDIHEACPKEWEPCCLCDGTAGGKESYYVMMLTVANLRQFQRRDGSMATFSRELLPVKAQQQGFFQRQLERHGTLRGLHLTMARDTKQTPAIGAPEFVALYPEEEVIATFGHPPVVDQQGRVVKQANVDAFPFPYEKLFKKPSGEDLSRRYGGGMPAGSRAEMRDAWGDEGAPQGAEPRGGISRITARGAAQGGAAQGGETLPNGAAADLDDDIPF